MRKRIVGSQQVLTVDEPREGWLDLESIATVEATSEDPSFPVESIFSLEEGPGWRASKTGEQQIRIIFDEPVSLQRIYLRFDEDVVERTQEFSLGWAPSLHAPLTEILRQQWNFSPTGGSTEIENYGVNLHGVVVLELRVRPDISRRDAIATLSEWRVR